MEKCPIDLEKAHYDELFYFALYGKPGVLKDDDPVLLTFMNQRLPPEKQVPVPEVETDDPVVLDLLGKKKLPEPPHIVEKLPQSLKQDTKDEELPVYRRSYIVNFDWSIVKGEYRALDYDKYMEVDESRPTARMCRLLTMVIFKLLVYLERYLLAILKKCASDISMINDKIQEYKCSGSSAPHKVSWLNMYGMPYFKDNHYFACPPNEDVQRKKCNGELLVGELPVTSSDWNAVDYQKLEQAIRNEEVKRRSEKVKHDRVCLLKALKRVTDEHQRAELEQKISAIPSLESIRSMPLKELCEDIDWEYDWLRIAAQDFDGYKHPDECRAVWQIFVHPKTNRGAWTDEENKKLKELVEDYNFQNWEAITEKLGTNRTPLLVMQHYQRNLNEGFVNKAWTDEEEELLKKLVQTCRIGSRISWKKIAQRMKGHTKQQIFKHWTYHVNPSICKGPFSKNEDMLLVAAVRSFGEDYSKLLELFPYRSRDQLRYRYRTLTKLHPNTWDASENEKLLALVDRFGQGKWKEICEYFNERTPTSLKQQYGILKEKMTQLTEGNSDLLESSEKEKETICEEHKLWRKVQQFFPALKECRKLDQRCLKELKGILVKEEKMVPQNIRTLNSFDKQCYMVFQCVSNPETMYENDLYESKKRLDRPHVLKYILHLLHGKLQVPKEGFRHSLLQIRDQHLLQELSEESFMVSEAGQECASASVCLKYSMPPNIATLGGFCSMLLHRRYVLDGQQEEKEEEVFVKAKKADDLFKKRFHFLFLWPALASVEPPVIGQPPPIDDSVPYTTRQPVRKGRKRKPTRIELLNIIGPKGKSTRTTTKHKQKCVASSEEDSSNVDTCTVIEINDESIYQTLLASQTQQINMSLPSTSYLCGSSVVSSADMKQQTNVAIASASTGSLPPSAGTFSFNTAKCVRTYSRVKKPKTDRS